MICPVCGTRWAPFPEEDFKFVSGKGFLAKREGAEERRKQALESNETRFCDNPEEEAFLQSGMISEDGAGILPINEY